MKQDRELKKLISEVKKHKGLLTIVAISGVLYATCYSQLALKIKDLMDYLSLGEPEKILPVIGVAIGLAFVSNVGRYVHLYTMNVIVEYVMQSFREQLQQKFMRLNLTFHNNYMTGAGGLISRILNDIRIIQDGLRIIADFFTAPLLMVLLVGNLLRLDWKLALITFTIIPFIAIFLKNVSQGLRKYIPIGQELLEKMTATIKETLDGMRIIQSFNLENLLADRYSKEGAEYIATRKKIHSRMETGPAIEFVATIVLLMVMYYVSFQVANQKTTTGAFMAFITSLLMINQPMKRFQEAYYRIQEVIVATRRIYEIIDAPSEVPQRGSVRKFPVDWKKITYKNVNFSYDKTQVLKNINFEINRGEMVAFVGESGSGKSTILNLLERFYDPSSGEILIDGVNIMDLELTELRKNIGLVSQDVFLFSDSISNNILSGNLLRNPDEIVEMAKLANAHDFITKLSDGYQSRVGDRGSLLSGGEKQRISIARALFKNAPIIILDEATSALDSVSETEVQKGLDSLTNGRTTLVVAHRLSTIQRADKIFVLKNGQIVQTGKHSDLIQNGGEYSRFYQIQNM